MSYTTPTELIGEFDELRAFARDLQLEVEPIPEKPLMWRIEPLPHLAEGYEFTQKEAMAFLLGVDACVNRPMDGLTNVQRQVLVLRQNGVKQADIARRLDVSKQRVSELVKLLREKGVLDA